MCLNYLCMQPMSIDCLKLTKHEHKIKKKILKTDKSSMLSLNEEKVAKRKITMKRTKATETHFSEFDNCL